ncbi:ATP-binding protein [Kordiimonas aquimaris]|uniref:ATP-binding protein n=1 Tax=Kordiimonas aquimaris TaxID=707591 RepID=UPI0021D12766|nr:ATP-binding protein [Kordiimonas aquimaris]
MTSQIIRSNVPVAVVLDSEQSNSYNVFTELDSNELTVVQAKSLSCLTEYSSKPEHKLSAIIIDATVGLETLEEAVSNVNARFIEDGGPVIILTDGEPEAHDPIININNSKVIDSNLGERALRRFIAEEIERYSIVSALRSEIEKRTSAIGQIVQGIFQFKTRREAQNLATMLSLTCNEPMPVAIGLTELFVNAIEHGCLEIGHDEKGQLLETGQLAEEISRRQKLKQFSDKVATVDFKRDEKSLFFVVRDPGPGFDHETYMSASHGHEKKHGRGIVMAKGCFSSLSYHGCGNEVRAVHTCSLADS